VVPKAGDWYAVKLIKKEKLVKDSHWRAILHEIEILKRIKSSYCIQLFDAFQCESGVYLVLEYIDGGELFDFIIKRGHLSEQEAMQITKQLMDALRYLHTDQKIVHRDLKPENILMVKDTMQIKLIDFGFAKFYGQHASQAADAGVLTPNVRRDPRELGALSPGATVPNTPSDLVMNTPLGSLKYCAPEILKRLVNHGVHARVTTRVDIQKLDVFAAGVVTYVMLGGSFPFSSKSKQALAMQIERGIKFPESRFQHVSEDAKNYCRWLLDPDRRKRPLAYETFNHPWLREKVPNTPLEIWHLGNSDPIDNAFFDEIREMDKKLETEQPAGQGLPQEGVPTVPPKPNTGIVLKFPKKKPAKGPPLEPMRPQPGGPQPTAPAEQQDGGSPTPADEHMKESEAARAAGEGPSAPAAPGNPQPMACWGNQPENTVQEGQPQEGGDAVPAPGASETWCQPMPKPAAQPAPTNIAPTDITPTDMSLDP
jgi:serine/threonine protein kinase